jgi:lipoate-protein ligase B
MSRPHAAPCLVQRLGIIEYQDASDTQRRLVQSVRAGGQPHLLLLEHRPVYTYGARAQPEHLLLDERALARLGASLHQADRGGDVTFHGPGQLVGYPILDVTHWGHGPRWYVHALEAVLIETLASFSVIAHRRPGAPGVWTNDAKIASIGVRISRGVTSHGFALNVSTDLQWFQHIVPCGLPNVRMTSIASECGAAPVLDDVMDGLVRSFSHVFDIAVEEAVPAGALAQ